SLTGGAPSSEVETVFSGSEFSGSELSPTPDVTSKLGVPPDVPMPTIQDAIIQEEESCHAPDEPEKVSSNPSPKNKKAQRKPSLNPASPPRPTEPPTPSSDPQPPPSSEPAITTSPAVSISASKPQPIRQHPQSLPKFWVQPDYVARRNANTDEEPPFESPQQRNTAESSSRVFGVRAEPKPLSAPSTLASISSFVTGLSSYVVDSINSSADASHHPIFDDTVFDKTENILATRFAWVDWDLPSDPKRVDLSCRKCLLLMLGYETGFQVWNVTDMDNVREICSVRDWEVSVHWIESVPFPSHRERRREYAEEVKEAGPLIAMGTEISSDPLVSDGVDSELRFYSLKSHTLVKSFAFKERKITELKTSEKVLALSLDDCSIHLFSLLYLKPLSILRDASVCPSTTAPIFDIGNRYIIYASSSPVPHNRKHSHAADQGSFSDTESDDNVRMPGASDGYGKVAGKVAVKVGKELIDGVKVIGAVGYSALSNYFSNKEGVAALPVSDTASTHTNTSSVGKDTGGYKSEKALPYSDGVIIIKEVPPPIHTATTSASDSNLLPTLAHWRPHTNPLSVIALSPSQSTFLTASTLANSFYIWSIPSHPSSSPSLSSSHHSRSVVKCLYKLERGYTPAQVSHVSFSLDERWVGVSTKRGTTHVYYLNPPTPAVNANGANGAAYELGVMNGLVDSRPSSMGLLGLLNSPDVAQKSASGVVSLYPVARIKQPLHSEKPAKNRTRPNGVSGHAHFDSGPIQEEPSKSNLSVAFLIDPWIHTHSRTAAPASSSINRSQYSGSSSGNLTHLATSPSTLSGLLGLDSKQVRLHRQRVLSVNPVLGTLTLHYIDVGVGVETPVAEKGPPLSAGALVGGASPSRWMGTSPSPRDRVSPSSFGANKANGGTANGPSGGGGVKVSVHDVMEWKVERTDSWKEVKAVISHYNGGFGQGKSKGSWLSQIETSTYDPVAFGTPLWLNSQFSIRIFRE
ncbi:hypothetical protein HDV05_007572, partial [Chytridiales sp. JEL 0842]